MEQDDLVDAIQEFRTESRAHHLHDLIANSIAVLVFTECGQVFRTEVRGHDDHRVLEVDGAPLTIGQTSIVKHLQKHVEDIRMRLLDLVEEHDLIGPATNGFRQRPTLLIADIAGRRADQAGYRVLLHIFRHVDPHKRGLVVEEEPGKRLGQLRLADARRA